MKLSQIHAQAASRAGSLDVGGQGADMVANEKMHATAPVAGAAPGMGPAGASA